MSRRLWLEWLMLPFAVIGLFRIVVWLDYREPVNIHFRVVRDISVPAGRMFSYDNYFVRHRFCDAVVERWLVGSDDIVRPIATSEFAMATERLHVRQRATRTFFIPPAMPAGISKTCVHPHWICNPIQRVFPIDGPVTCIEFIVEPRAPFRIEPL